MSAPSKGWFTERFDTADLKMKARAGVSLGEVGCRDDRNARLRHRRGFLWRRVDAERQEAAARQFADQPHTLGSHPGLAVFCPALRSRKRMGCVCAAWLRAVGVGDPRWADA